MREGIAGAMVVPGRPGWGGEESGATHLVFPTLTVGSHNAAALSESMLIHTGAGDESQRLTLYTSRPVADQPEAPALLYSCTGPKHRQT